MGPDTTHTPSTHPSLSPLTNTHTYTHTHTHIHTHTHTHTQERSSYLEYQKVTRELEHLSRLTIAWQYWQAEVNVISMCAQQGPPPLVYIRWLESRGK